MCLKLGGAARTRWCEGNKWLCEVWGWTAGRSISHVDLIQSPAHLYSRLWEFHIGPGVPAHLRNKTTVKYCLITFPSPGKSLRSSASQRDSSSRWKAEQVRRFQTRHWWSETARKVTIKGFFSTGCRFSCQILHVCIHWCLVFYSGLIGDCSFLYHSLQKASRNIQWFVIKAGSR